VVAQVHHALVGMVFGVFAGVWSAGTECIMSSGGKSNAGESGCIARRTDHTKPLRTHCALPCSMWLQPSEGANGRCYSTMLLLLLLLED
jgi:hypothetical protein